MASRYRTFLDLIRKQVRTVPAFALLHRFCEAAGVSRLAGTGAFAIW